MGHETMDMPMKLALTLIFMTSVNFASTNTAKWTPKYEKSENKKIEKKILKGEVIPSTSLEALYLKEVKHKSQLVILKKESLALKQDAVPTLLKVMRSNHYPSESRWVATYMLGRIMGVKAAPLISKYASHSNWMLRLASLKVLLHLGQKKYKGIYARLLEDQSLIVRHQALQNIKKMEIKELAPYVWKMLYNKKNYVGMDGQKKRSNIIKDAIKTVGDLGFTEAKKPMLKMFSKNKYKDVYSELDYSLSKLSDKPSPDGSLAVKKIFWKKAETNEITI